MRESDHAVELTKTENWTSNRLPVESPSVHGNAPVGIILVQKTRHFNALSGTYIINESHVVIHCDGRIFAAKFFCCTGVIAGPERSDLFQLWGIKKLVVGGLGPGALDI